VLNNLFWTGVYNLAFHCGTFLSYIFVRSKTFDCTGVPVLTSDGKVVAVVEFKGKKIDHDVFTEDDEKLAEMLASHMSIIFMTKMGDSLNR